MSESESKGVSECELVSVAEEDTGLMGREETFNLLKYVPQGIFVFINIYIMHAYQGFGLGKNLQKCHVTPPAAARAWHALPIACWLACTPSTDNGTHYFENVML